MKACALCGRVIAYAIWRSGGLDYCSCSCSMGEPVEPMPEPAPEVGEVCAFCGAVAEGNYSINRDGFGIGPEVPLCDACGKDPTPKEVTIWARIGQASECIQCDEEIRAGDERRGSFHSWCAPSVETEPEDGDEAAP